MTILIYTHTTAVSYSIKDPRKSINTKNFISSVILIGNNLFKTQNITAYHKHIHFIKLRQYNAN